jgi:hypothetical protein
MNDPKDIWQKQSHEHSRISVAELQDKLRTLHRRLRVKGAATAIVGLIALYLFAGGLLDAKQASGRIGWGIIILGTVIVLVPSIYESYRMISRGTLASNPGLTTSLDFYRDMLERQRSLLIGRRSLVWRAGTGMVLTGLAVLIIPEIRQFYRLLQAPERRSLLVWMPFGVILTLWVVAVVIISRRQRSWLRREFESLETLEKKQDG